jgi:hypothetical protein
LFILPARNPSLRGGSAARFDGAISAGMGQTETVRFGCGTRAAAAALRSAPRRRPKSRPNKNS